jgi:hypothetical protein
MTLQLAFEQQPDPVTAQIQQASTEMRRLSLSELAELHELIEQSRLFVAPRRLQTVARSIEWLVKEDGARHKKRALWAVRFAIIDHVKRAI